MFSLLLSISVLLFRLTDRDIAGSSVVFLKILGAGDCQEYMLTTGLVFSLEGGGIWSLSTSEQSVSSGLLASAPRYCSDMGGSCMLYAEVVWTAGVAVCCGAEVVCWTAGIAVGCGAGVVCWTAVVAVCCGAAVVCCMPWC